VAVDKCVEFPADGIWCIPVRSPRRAAGGCARRLLLVARLGKLRSFRGRFGYLARPRVLVLQVSISTQGGTVSTGTITIPSTDSNAGVTLAIAGSSTFSPVGRGGSIDN